MVKTEYLSLSTNGFGDMIDITDRITDAISKSGITSGTVTVFVPGATAGLTTIEYEGGLIRDFTEFMEKILPQDASYHHNDRWGDGNGFSHMRASLLGPSLSVPFVEKNLLLGTWQQVILVDFDNSARKRRVVCQIIGE